MSIDEFMMSRNFSSQTGYIGKVQKKQFQRRLSRISGIRSILEIGLNAGHSAECFFESCKDLEHFVSFDINAFPYTKPAAEYLKQLHPNQFVFIEGDSLATVPAFARKFPEQKFDLIYIDGSHQFENVIGDIMNTRLLAHKKTILWMDDYHYCSIFRAIHFCETLGMIQKKKMFAPKDANDPERKWIEARFVVDYTETNRGCSIA